MPDGQGDRGREGNVKAAGLPLLAALCVLLVAGVAYVSHYPLQRTEKAHAPETPTTMWLPDSYAKAALLALIKIKSDEIPPVTHNGKQFGNETR